METGMEVAKKRDRSENWLSEDKMPPNASDYFLPQEAIKTENTLEDIEEAEEPTECDSEELRYGAGDALFAALIVTPQVVSVWRGTWGLMELQANLFPNVQIFVLGITIHVCFALVRSYLLSRSKNAWGEEARAGRWVRERVLCRIYTYIFVLSNIMHWRGGFGLLDSLILLIVPSDDNYYRGLFYAVFTILFYIAMVSFRSSRTLLAPPYFVVTDGKEFTYVFSTRFQNKVDGPILVESYFLNGSTE